MYGCVYMGIYTHIHTYMHASTFVGLSLAQALKATLSWLYLSINFWRMGANKASFSPGQNLAMNRVASTLPVSVCPRHVRACWCVKMRRESEGGSREASRPREALKVPQSSCMCSMPYILPFSGACVNMRVGQTQDGDSHACECVNVSATTGNACAVLNHIGWHAHQPSMNAWNSGM